MSVVAINGLTHLPQKQRGLSLVLAIFIVVVLSLLGAAMMNIMAVGSESVAREVLSTRALLVAESGAQSVLNRIFPPGSAVSVPGQCVLNATPLLTGVQGCSNLVIDVDCVPNALVGDGNIYYTMTSTGSCGPLGEQAIRVFEVQAKGI